MPNTTKIGLIPKTTTTTVTFLPTSVAACALWLDAADPAGNGVVPANGATVTTWADKSGNSANGTAAGGAITYNSSANGLTFNGSYFSLPNNTISPGAANYTIFCVVKPTSISNYPYLWFAGTGGPAGQAMALVFYPTGEVENGFWTDFMGIAPAGTVAINNTYMFSSAYNGAIVGRVLYKNGTSVVSGTPTTTKNTQASSSVSIGGSSVLTGIYHELIVFNSFLGTTNRQTVEAYLAQKWGLTASLPVGHPGLTTSVYIQTVALAVTRQKIRFIPRAATFTNFVPTSVAGCSLWLDAADSSSITGTTTVTAWADKSGLGNSPTFGTNKPSFIGNYIDTANSNVDFIIPISTINRISGQGGVLFFVFADKQTNSNYPALFSDGTPLNRFYQILLNSYGYEVGGNKLSQTGLNAMNTTNFIIYAFSYITGSSIVVRVNGSEILSSSSYAPNPSGQIYIGKDGWGDGTGNLKLNEILFYKNTLTTTQIQTVESYLAQKWGFTSQLAPGHPGLTTTVYGTVAAAPTVRQKIAAITITVIPIFPYSITSGLLAFFSFNNTLADSQNTITLTATGSISYAAGRTTGQAIYLANEANSAASTFAANYLTSSYNVTVPFSVSVWFKPTNTNQGSLLSTYNSTGITNYSVNLYINGGSMSAAYNNIQNVGASVGVSVGTWYHAVITVNASNGLTLFVNNSQVGSTITQTPSINGLMIGSIRDSGASYAFSGYMDDYRIYNRVLTGTEIGQIYAGTG